MLKMGPKQETGSIWVKAQLLLRYTSFGTREDNSDKSRLLLIVSVVFELNADVDCFSALERRRVSALAAEVNILGYGIHS
jgi:hypothetical protein